MKAKIGILIFVLAGVLSAVELVKNVDFSINDLSFTKRSGYDCVTMKGAWSNFEVGRSNLPVKVVNLIIPADAEVQESKFSSETFEISGNYRIAPVREPLGFDQVIGVEPMPLDSSQIYPREIAKISYVGYFAGNKIVSILVYPLQYLPNQGKLVLNENIQLTVRYQRTATNGIIKQRGFPEYDNKIEKTLKKFVDNPEKLSIQTKEDLTGTVTAQKFMPMESPSLLGSPVQYVVITNDALASNFQTLADWKMKKGIPIVIKTIAWIESHYNGNDIQERIRNFIKDAYANWGIDYVLIGGDDGIVPTRMTVLNFNGLLAPFIVTDWYYACLDGNWNKNGNEYFGELLDSVDLYPEVFVGRLPVNNAAEANAMIAKITDYEENPGNNYLTHALFLGENMFDPGDGKMLCDSIADHHFPGYYTKTNLYEVDGNENRNTVINALNAGQGIVYYQGHGSTNTLGVGPDYLYHIDFDTLSNENKYSLWYGTSCYTSRFDCDGIGEHFVRNPNGGGVAFIASTTNDFPFDNFVFDETFFDFFFDSSYYNIGDANTLSKASLVGYYQYWQPYISAMYGRILLGDPEMPVWTNDPAFYGLNVFHPDTVGLGPSDFSVEVRWGMYPIAEARVCVMKGNEFFATGYTNSQGQVLFEVCPESCGTISVVVTKHNYSTYEGTCSVTPDIPYVSYMSHEINDNLGNNNGLIDAGEPVFITMTLKNLGIGNANNVTATLWTESAYITILDSVENFGRIQAGQFVTVENAFKIKANANTPDQSEVTLKLRITATQGTYNDNFEIGVYAPILIHSGHIVTSNEPGPYTMRLKVRDDGCGEDRGLWAALSSDDPDVTITNDSIWLGTIAGRSEITSTQSFQFETEQPLDSISDFRIIIKDILNRTVSDTFIIAAPTTPYNLTYQPYPDKIKLTWDIIPGPLYGFNVYRANYQALSYERDGDGISRPVFTKINETPITNGCYFMDCNLTAGTKYYYKVTAVDSSMNEGPYSNQLLTATNPTLKTGWPMTMEFDTDFSSPFACELAPSYPGLEIVGLDRFGTIYAWHCDGTGLISSDGVFARTGMRSWTSPAAADIDLDGQIEIVYVASRTSPDTTRIFVYKPNGTLMWSSIVGLHWSVSSPVIGQFDQLSRPDAQLEIIATLTNGDVYVFQHNGAKTLFASCSSTVFSSPALGDVDGNGKNDVWVGTQSGIYAWDDDGDPIEPFTGWPGGEDYDFSSIVIGDITPTSSGLEIATVDRYMANAYIVDRYGNCLSGWPTGFSAPWDLLMSPSLGNLDSDNDLELVIGGDPEIFAFNSDGSILDGFPVPRLANYCSNPVIADIDNNQDYEIIVGSGGEDWRFYGYHHNGVQILGFPIPAVGATSTPFLGDIDGDNKLEMIVSCHDHRVYVYELDEANYYANCSQWPTYRHDLKRTGNYSTPLPMCAIMTNPNNLIPTATRLYGAYPIPFYKNLNLQIDVAQETEIMVKLYNVVGIKVDEISFGKLSPGHHYLILDQTTLNKPLANGVYFLKVIRKDGNCSDELGLVKVIYCK